MVVLIDKAWDTKTKEQIESNMDDYGYSKVDIDAAEVIAVAIKSK